MRIQNNKARFAGILVTIVGILLSASFLAAIAQKDDKPHRTDLFSALESNIKPQYFLGEDIPLTISALDAKGQKITNENWKNTKFDFQLESDFGFEDRVITKKIPFDGSIPPLRREKIGKNAYILVSDTKEAKNADGVLLSSLNADTISINLTRDFNVALGVGEYKFLIRSEAGSEYSADFSIVFDDQNSTPVLKSLLMSESRGEQNWAYFNLTKFNRGKLITFLEEMKLSGDDRLQKQGKDFLYQMKVDNLR